MYPSEKSTALFHFLLYREYRKIHMIAVKGWMLIKCIGKAKDIGKAKEWSLMI